MASMCDDLTDSDAEEHENDITSQRITHHLYHQQVLSDDEGYDADKVCVTSSDVGHISLRMPSKEEIDRIIAEMISQVHSNYKLRNRTVDNDAGKPSSVFIKYITHKMNDESKKINTDAPKIKNNKVKKWEPKGKVQFQMNETTKPVVQGKKLGPDTIKQTVVPTIQKTPAPSILVKPIVPCCVILNHPSFFFR